MCKRQSPSIPMGYTGSTLCWLSVLMVAMFLRNGPIMVGVRSGRLLTNLLRQEEHMLAAGLKLRGKAILDKALEAVEPVCGSLGL